MGAFFGAAALCAMLLQQSGAFRVRYTSVLSVLFIVCIVWFFRIQLYELRHKTFACFCFTLSLLIPTLLAESIAVPVVSWSFAFFLWSALPDGSAGAKTLIESTDRVSIFAIMAATLGTVIFVHILLRNGVSLIIDEALYLIQSSVFKDPYYARKIDPSLRPFFILRHSYFIDDRFYSQFPPGWPLILSLFNALNLRSWANCVLAPLAVGATYLLGKRLTSALTGLVAAVLLATNPTLIGISAGYFGHAIGILLSAISGFLLLYSEDAGVVRRRIAWFGAGFLLAFLVTVRPLTGLGIGISLTLWMLVRGRIERKDWGGLFLFMTAGSVCPLLFFLHYNAVTTGKPFVVGYQLANRGLNNLGFGKRGMIVYDEQGEPVEESSQFTPTIALKQALERAYDTVFTLVPAFIVFPLLVLGLNFGYRIDWHSVLVFLVLPTVYVFYVFSDIRFLLELLPYLCMGVATVLVFLHSKSRGVAHSLIIFIVVCNLGQSAQRISNARTQVKGTFSYFNEVEELRRKYGKVIAFVERRTSHEYLLEALYWFNVDNFPGDVIVARSIRDKNSILTQRFPDHTPVYIKPRS